MKLSIIIPAYNTGKLLSRCVDSIVVPNGWEYEVIIVDDGSTDGITSTICDEKAKADSHVKVIHTGNNGAYEARHTGVAESSGDWIMFMDSDDTLTAGGISGLIRHMPCGADIIAGTLNLNNKSTFSHKITGLVDKKTYIAGLLQLETSIGPCGKLYRRQLFDNRPIKPEKRITVNEDLLMLLTAASHANKIFIDNDLVCYNYIFQENSMRTSSMSPETWDCLFSLIKEIIAPCLCEDEIKIAYRRYRIHLINVCMIRKGQFVTVNDAIVKNLLSEDCRQNLNDEEKHVLKLLESPLRQRLYHLKFSMIARAKKAIKKIVGI